MRLRDTGVRLNNATWVMKSSSSRRVNPAGEVS
jgi:hypothetical protein